LQVGPRAAGPASAGARNLTDPEVAMPTMMTMGPIALSLTMLAFSAAAPARTDRDRSSSCADSAFHALDFWIGNWDVTTPAGRPAGKSRVERISEGCAVLERWYGAGNAGGAFIGTAIHVYDLKTRAWRQFWVDNRPAITEMRATVVGGVFTYSWTVTNPQGQETLQRYTLARDGDGVRQVGTTSTDGGTTWKPSFDLRYRPAI
jgi:hypothetical protein